MSSTKPPFVSRVKAIKNHLCVTLIFLLFPLAYGYFERVALPVHLSEKIAENSELKRKIFKLDDTIVALNKQLKLDPVKMSEYERQIGDLKRQNIQQKQKFDELAGQLASEKHNQTQCKETLIDQKEQLLSCNNEFGRLKQASDQTALKLKSTIAELNRTNSSLSAANHSLSGKIETLKLSNTSHLETINRLIEKRNSTELNPTNSPGIQDALNVTIYYAKETQALAELLDYRLNKQGFRTSKSMLSTVVGQKNKIEYDFSNSNDMSFNNQLEKHVINIQDMLHGQQHCDRQRVSGLGNQIVIKLTRAMSI